MSDFPIRKELNKDPIQKEQEKFQAIERKIKDIMQSTDENQRIREFDKLALENDGFAPIIKTLKQMALQEEKEEQYAIFLSNEIRRLEIEEKKYLQSKISSKPSEFATDLGIIMAAPAEVKKILEPKEIPNNIEEKHKLTPAEDKKDEITIPQKTSDSLDSLKSNYSKPKSFIKLLKEQESNPQHQQSRYDYSFFKK